MGEKKIDEYMTIEDASIYTKMGKSTLKKRVAEKALPAYKPGRHLLFLRQDLDNMIRRSRV